MTGWMVALFLLLSTNASTGARIDGVRPADIVFRNGNIYTVDAVRSWAQALAVRDGVISFVGSNETARAHIGPDTRVVDLAERMVLPGMQDAHIHPMWGGMEALACSLNGLETIAQYVEAVEKYVREHPDEPWILGGGWHQSKWNPAPAPAIRGYPTHEALSRISSDNPVFLSHASGRAALANARAMQIASISIIRFNRKL